MYVYILTNPGKSVLYIGVTNNLVRRLREHEVNRGSPKTFAGRYYCNKLIYYETFDRPYDAIRREKEIKKLSRENKFKLIKSKNPKLQFYIL
ncbi:MAG: GIY-YIG nuclease family protein [Bacteroidia bacterium]